MYFFPQTFCNYPTSGYSGSCDSVYSNPPSNRFCNCVTTFACDLIVEIPIPDPTTMPTFVPTTPTASPTFTPTLEPSEIPTFSPTARPSVTPTTKPSTVPTVQPSAVPTVFPTTQPTTNEPTLAPSDVPSFAPTFDPSAEPSPSPSSNVTFVPTASPTGCFQWILGYAQESCALTCARVGGSCDNDMVSTIITQSAFYDMVASSIALGASSPPGSASSFCSVGINLYVFAPAPAAYSTGSGNRQVNQKKKTFIILRNLFL